MKNENIYYVYLHIKLTDGTPLLADKLRGDRKNNTNLRYYKN